MHARGCGARDKPGHAVMPSIARPGKLQDEVECDLMFYKQEQQVFRIIDRCLRCGSGIEMPYKTVTNI
eukprot:2069030-Pyramimonas_sp.AAC.1